MCFLSYFFQSSQTSQFLYLGAVVSRPHSSPTFLTRRRSLSWWWNSQCRPLCQMFADVFLCVGAGQQIPEPSQNASCHGHAALLGAWRKNEIVDLYSLARFLNVRFLSPYLALQYSSEYMLLHLLLSTQIHQCFPDWRGPARSVFLASSLPG